MPNWTWNRINCKKSLVEKFISENEEGKFLDFNKIIPMPQELMLTAGSVEDEAVASYYYSLKKRKRRDLEVLLKISKISFYGNYWNKYNKVIEKFKDNENLLKEVAKNYEQSTQTDNYKHFDNLIDLGKQYVENIYNFGYSNWYEWRSSVWGTKWNSFDCDIEYDEESEEYEITFNTAWSVPYNIVSKFASLCEDGELHWVYEDEEYDGTHALSKENGKIIEEIIDYSPDVEENEEVVI